MCMSRDFMNSVPVRDPLLLPGTVCMVLSDWVLSLGRLRSCDIKFPSGTTFTEYYHLCAPRETQKIVDKNA